MSGSARGKVDSHLAYANELLRLANIHDQQAALSSSACLQFEMAIGFYLMELLQTSKNRISPWPVSKESLTELMHQNNTQDIHELRALLVGEEDSWLNRMLNRLVIMRRCDATRMIKGEIFQSDLEESANTPRLIASSRSEKNPGMDAKLIATDLKAFESLVSRQRLGHEEY